MTCKDFEKRRIEVIRLYDMNMPAKEILKNIDISPRGYYSIIKRYNERGDFKRKTGSGRKPILNIDQRRQVLKKIESNNKISAKRIANEMREIEKIDISRRSISRMLVNSGFESRVPAFKPMLTKKHKNERFEMMKKWSMWSASKFQRIIFSDECRFEVDGNDGTQRIRRLSGTRYESSNIIGKYKYGKGGIMVWGCITYEGVGKLAIVDTTLDRYGYTRILSENLFDVIDNMQGDNEIFFQQDNAPCHKAKHTLDFFENNSINLLKWPAQSPDLNPIENLWSFMKHELKKNNIKSKKDLANKVKQIWENIPNEYIKSLYKSIPKRIEEVLRAKGGHTRY